MASGDTLATFYPADNEPPASGYATLDTRNAHPVLDFDAGATEAAVFSAILPRNYGGGGITVYLHWGASSATSGNVIWQTSFERIGDGSQDTDSDGFATAVTWSAQAASGTSGNVVIDSQAHTDGAQIDSIAVGELFRLKVERVGGSGSDTMTGDAELFAVELKET
jgi:hypothetical protein